MINLDYTNQILRDVRVERQENELTNTEWQHVSIESVCNESVSVAHREVSANTIWEREIV